MITDTDGIVLRQTLFGDNDIIVKILTKKLGVISFMVKSGRKSKKKKIPATFNACFYFI